MALPLRLLAQQRIGRLDAIPLAERKQYAERLSLLAYQWVNGGKRRDGLVLYDLATALAPHELDIWLARIDAYANEWDAVRDLYVTAADLFPGDPYLDIVKAFASLYGANDAATARFAADRALATITVSTDLSTSPHQVALQLVHDPGLTWRVPSKLAAADWLERAANLPVSSYFKNLAYQRATGIDARSWRQPSFARRRGQVVA